MVYYWLWKLTLELEKAKGNKWKFNKRNKRKQDKRTMKGKEYACKGKVKEKKKENIYTHSWTFQHSLREENSERERTNTLKQGVFKKKRKEQSRQRKRSLEKTTKKTTKGIKQLWIWR